MLITARRSPRSARHSFCLARGCCSELAGSVPTVALLFHAVWACLCALCTLDWWWAGQKRPAATRGSLTEEEESCFLRILPLSGRQSRARGEVFYPLMNWDCWSKVWIIEFLINYPELLSDKSAPLQPPSSSGVFYLIWSASCSPGPALRRPCLINADLVTETDAAVCLSACVFWCQSCVLFSALVVFWFCLPQTWLIFHTRRQTCSSFVAPCGACHQVEYYMERHPPLN